MFKQCPQGLTVNFGQSCWSRPITLASWGLRWNLHTLQLWPGPMWGSSGFKRYFSSPYPRRDWTPPMKCLAALMDLCLQSYMHYEYRTLQKQCSSVVQSINVLLCEYVLHVLIAYAIRFIRCRCPGTFAASGGAVAVGWQEDKVGFTVCCNCNLIRDLCYLMHVQSCDIRCPHISLFIWFCIRCK